MEISWAQSDRLTAAKITGHVSADEFFVIAQEFFRACTPDMIVDLSGADLCDISVEDLRWILERSADKYPDCPKKRAEANGVGIWIGGDDLQYGLGRVIETYAEIIEYHVPIYAVRSRDEAIQILAAVIDRRMKRILAQEGLAPYDDSIC